MKKDEESLESVANSKISRQLSAIEQRRTQRKSAQVVQLPFWPDSTRGVPCSVLRGALFAAIQGQHRQALKGELLATQRGVEIRFTGWQLDQSDLDVWEQALHLAREHPLGTRCDFTAHAFLKALGRSTGKKDYEWLKNSFRRLGSSLVEITHNGKTYAGTFLEFYRDEATGSYRLELNPKLKALYEAGWTAIDWGQRKKLTRKPLAQWLHGFLASHAKPLPLTVEYLKRISGSRNPDIRSFKRQLKTALAALKAIGAVVSYDFDKDRVIILRKPTASQRRLLSKKRKEDAR
jgi:hypothetical protein